MTTIVKTFSTNTKLYLTSKLYILGYNCYFENDTGKDIIVNNKNWHHYFNDYGWTKMSDIWIRRLNKYSLPKPKNNLFGVLDCGSGGDCLFHCIAHALNQKREPGDVLDAQDVRKKASLCINHSNFDNIIEIYRLQEQYDEFEGLYNPKEIKTVRAFRTIIEKMGNTFWGDHIILQLLENAYNINIVLMKTFTEGLYSHEEIKKKTGFYPTGNELNKKKDTIFLCYEDEIHFTLVGYFNKNNMNCIFEWNEIPQELIVLYNIDCSVDYSREFVK